ncbi:MAG: MBL fold metallo-hydrolase [Myxococcota bacterium]|jgi:flavorubredoxin|nr:MBL fold metallo-hydrolase [Myxococcota bacterium]
MNEVILFQKGNHLNVLLEDATGTGMAVQANHHVIVHGGEALILDPGGHKVFNKVFSDTSEQCAKIRYLFLSHQDPDIVAATNGWLMVTDADALVSSLWTRFVPHFGVDTLLEDRLLPVPDEGQWIELGGAPLAILPAHFLHSAGNLHLYDPESKILYSGDLGASLGMSYREVPDFDAHLQYMRGFHQRYMASSSALQAWVRMVRTLDLELIAPQHGALFRGRDMVQRFLSWCEGLACGIDLMLDTYQVPARP